MNAASVAIKAAERLPLPDAVTRAGIGYLCGRMRRTLAKMPPEATSGFAAAMSDYPIALATSQANEQHYEIPPEFFELILGRRRKYSCCFYDTDDIGLDAAEERSLELTCANAEIEDGQRILELGCGWGSLTLWLAEKYPSAKIHAVSNSANQRAFIEARAADHGFRNIEITTADMNTFDTAETYDRVVSVEMFEHMSNWQPLMRNTARWLAPGGRFFMHVFTHRTTPYRFDHTDPADWIAQYFFTGGIMPSQDLASCFGDILEVEDRWHWSGKHYALTARDWLANYDANSDRIDTILKDVYGADAALWRRRWRLFFLSTMGLFGHREGDEWGVSHYRLKHPD